MKTPLTPSQPDAYEGQYLRAIKRAHSIAWYFKPKDDQTPDEWLTRYGKTVRVPRDPGQRIGGKAEESAAFLDAAKLWAEFNALRKAPENGRSWPHGSLRWLIMQWRASPWFRNEIAAHTQDGYESCLRALEAWADEHAARHSGIHHPVSRMTAAGVHKLLSRWDDRPTRQRHIKAVLSNLFVHGLQIGAVSQNPVSDVRLARRKRGMSRKRPVVLWDQSFVDAAIAHAQSKARPELAAWVGMMWDIGRRPTDLHGMLVLDDIARQRLMRGQITEGMFYDPRDRVVRGWQSKTHKWGALSLDDSTVALIEAVRPRVEDGANARHVFINPHTGEPFSFEQFGHAFKAYCAMPGGLPTTTPQMGRHSAIMRLYRAGASDDAVRNVTGHASPDMIKRKYWVEDDAQADAAKAIRAQNEANPRTTGQQK